MSPELTNLLFLDIETVACTDNFQTLDERYKTQWSRKATFLKRNEYISDEDLFHERAGIYAEFGKIVCIAVGMLYETESGELGLKTKAYCDHDEHKLLTDFKNMADRLEPTAKLCAHNGKEFDFPYLCRRLLVNGIVLPNVLNIAGRKPWETSHIDTMDMWKFGDYKHYTSLDLLATLFKIPSSKNATLPDGKGIDGSQVNYVYYKENDLEKIKNYCIKDVVVLTQLYLRMKSLAVISENNIQHAH